MDVAESRHLKGSVYFYRLTRKFIDEKDNIPQDAKQVMYYSLAIGHHLGIVDCLSAAMVCTGPEYLEWISALDTESEAYRKMKGFLMFGEITIYPEHINMLALAFDAIDANAQSVKSRELTVGFIEVLTAIYNEPTMYLMIRGG
ncbi:MULTISPECIES: formate hydrogenlyase maturation HycH family protein [Vibrio]|uniref:Formate hydrogenlyase maturation protein HycH n=2 Tax=Vibrio TaxID=662 RepID=A0A7X4RTV6_9VIBR|nr:MULTISPECIES: formate hydrogenlyase maturation HycH family protein [Vibrio]MBF9001435.1 formate hydrogenlyase maturation HycH family protein [Vibrio nitrifigilis]MZI92650.1 formate hydrogenlyase maturation protein HycH [Vibrio eleionomae]